MNTDEQFEQWWSRQKLGGFMNDQITADHVRAGWRIGAAAEREACAKVADAAGALATGIQFIGRPTSDEVKVAVEATIRQVGKNIAEAIRSRTED